MSENSEMCVLRLPFRVRNKCRWRGAGPGRAVGQLHWPGAGGWTGTGMSGQPLGARGSRMSGS